MSTVEDRVRDALLADAQSVWPAAVPVLHLPDSLAPARPQAWYLAWRRPRPGRGSPDPHRPGKARWLLPVAAAAAVILLVAGSAALSARAGHRPAPATPVPRIKLPAGAPPYYIAHPQNADREIIYSAATGRQVAQLRTPPGFTLVRVAATGQPYTFVVLAESTSRPATVRLYRALLDHGGHPALRPWRQLSAPGIPGGLGTLAATPDGSTIAFTTWLAGPGRWRVEVAYLSGPSAQDTVKVWTDGRGASDPGNLSFSADGRWLAYSAGSPAAFAVLDTSSPGGSLQRFSRRLPGGAPDWSALNSRGTARYGCVIDPSGQVSSPAMMTYLRISAHTGASQVIARWSDLTEPVCWAALDPAGHYALIEYPAAVPGSGQQAVPAILNLATGQLQRIPATPFAAPVELSW